MTPAEFLAIRKQAGLTQEALARLLWVTGNMTIHRWETGKRAIPGPVSVLMELLRDGRL